MALVPTLKAFMVLPVGEEPDFFGFLGGADDIEPNEAGGGVDEMRALKESLLNLRRHSVGNFKFTERDE